MEEVGGSIPPISTPSDRPISTESGPLAGRSVALQPAAQSEPAENRSAPAGDLLAELIAAVVAHAGYGGTDEHAEALALHWLAGWLVAGEPDLVRSVIAAIRPAGGAS